MATFTLTVYRAHTLPRVTFKLLDNVGEAVDITGYTFRLKALNTDTSSHVVLFDYSVTEGDEEAPVGPLTIDADPTTGLIYLDVTWQETEQFAIGKYSAELQETTPQDEKFQIAKGTIIVKELEIDD